MAWWYSSRRWLSAMPARSGHPAQPGGEGQAGALGKIQEGRGRALPPAPHQGPGIGFGRASAFDVGFGDEGWIGLGQQGGADVVAHGDPLQGDTPFGRHGVPMVLEGAQEGERHHHVAQLAREADPHLGGGPPDQGLVELGQGRMAAVGAHPASRARGMVMQRGPPRARLSSLASIWTRYFFPSSRSRAGSARTSRAVRAR